MRTEIAEISIPLVLGVVGIGADLVETEVLAVTVFDLVAKGRREDANVDYRLEIAGSVLSADVCTQEGIVERVVGIVIVNGLDGLRLHVTGEFERGFFFRFFGRGSFCLRGFSHRGFNCRGGFCRRFCCRSLRNGGFGHGSFNGRCGSRSFCCRGFSRGGSGHRRFCCRGSILGENVGGEKGSRNDRSGGELCKILVHS